MRINFTPQQSQHYGRELTKIIRGASGSADGRVSLEHFEGTFHGLSTQEQTNLFARPLWTSVVKPNLPPFSTEQSTTKSSNKSIAIIPDFRGGVDVMILLDSSGDDIEIKAIDLQKGGLAANTAEALIKLGYDSKFCSLHGRGPIADFHEFLLRDAGINPIDLIDSGRDAYLHPCTVESSDRKQEFWFVEKREPFLQSVTDEITEILKTQLSSTSNEALVLSAISPEGLSPDYFAEMSLVAHSNNKPVIFNPKQYDDNEEISTSLFSKGRVDLIKPNAIEFAQFLKYADILYIDEQGKASELKREIGKQQFGQTIAMARRFIQQYRPRLKTLFITFSEQGLLAVTVKHAVFIPTPKIKLACSSGAGDSGVAGIIAEAKKGAIDLQDDLHSSDLERLGLAFNNTAAATAKLPGSTIASQDQIAHLRSTHPIKPIVIQ